MKPALLLLAALPLFSGEFTYRQAVPGYHYQFPRDYFEHPAFRTEWWYYTGNVQAPAGKRFGFQLVFFRQGRRGSTDDNRSTWRIDDLYLAHLALTDIDGRRFLRYKRLNRAGPGIAGASFDQRRIWNGNWSAQWEDERQTLNATAEEMRLHLQLKPMTPVVINGENGVSQKAPGPGRASHYISFPRLSVEGEINGQRVSGTAWMDHEWFTRQLAENQIGWDWFSIQLANGTEAMLFEIRREDGTIDPHSSGTFIDRDGRARHLRASDFRLKPLETWTSPKTRTRYPVRWSIEIVPAGVTLECQAALENQEQPGEGETPGYWEGAVVYRSLNRNESGVGYLEMTGYDKPVRLD
ncbi:MAG: lipocalin-like domain-containing protein [Bryobacteraceae bacterium]